MQTTPPAPSTLVKRLPSSHTLEMEFWKLVGQCCHRDASRAPDPFSIALLPWESIYVFFWLKQATGGRLSPASVNVPVLGLRPPLRFCLFGMRVQYAFCRLPRPVFRQNILTVRPPSCLSNCLWEALGFAFPEPLAL